MSCSFPGGGEKQGEEYCIKEGEPMDWRLLNEREGRKQTRAGRCRSRFMGEFAESLRCILSDQKGKKNSLA